MRITSSLVALLLLGRAFAQQPYPSSAPSINAWQPSAVELKAPQHILTANRAQQGRPLGQPGDRTAANDDDRSAVRINLEPPGLEVLAGSVRSDAQLQATIQQEDRDRGDRDRGFPTDPILSTDTYNGRKWYPMRMEVAPYYVCHGRLYFQQINFERYGWNLGIIEPFICGAIFLYDFVTFPYHLAKEPCRCFEYNTGWCLPGDPVPLLLYPLEISATGFVAEVGTILTLVAVFP